jgi:HSP20 family protein
MTKISTWNPWRVVPRGFFDLEEDLDFDSFSNVRMDLYEEGDQILVELEAPGFKKDDIDIRVESNQLTISGNLEEVQEEKGKKRKYYRKEIKNLSFTRTCDLPVPVDASKAEAKFKDGVLRISLPKKEEAKPKQIEVKVG